MRAPWRPLTARKTIRLTAARRPKARHESLRDALPPARLRQFDARQAGGDGRSVRSRKGRRFRMGERRLDGLFPCWRQTAADGADAHFLAAYVLGRRSRRVAFQWGL